MKTLLDVHTHTVASGHAFSSLQEMAQVASEKGLRLLGITEHAPSIPGTCAQYDYIYELLQETKFPEGLILNDKVEEFKSYIGI